MQAQGFLAPPGRDMSIGDVLVSKGDVPALLTVTTRDSVRKAVDLMRKMGISQLPVTDEKGVIVGAMQEVAAMQLVFDHVDINAKQVGEIMGRPFPKMSRETEIEQGFKALSLGAAAIIVTEKDQPVGVLTKTDFIEYLSAMGDLSGATK